MFKTWNLMFSFLLTMKNLQDKNKINNWEVGWEQFFHTHDLFELRKPICINDVNSTLLCQNIFKLAFVATEAFFFISLKSENLKK